MENKYKEILSQIITPSYLFDVDAFKDRCFEIKEIVGENVDLCYSMKANPFLIEFLPDCISRVEVCVSIITFPLRWSFIPALTKILKM